MGRNWQRVQFAVTFYGIQNRFLFETTALFSTITVLIENLLFLEQYNRGFRFRHWNPELAKQKICKIAAFFSKYKIILPQNNQL